MGAKKPAYHQANVAMIDIGARNRLTSAFWQAIIDFNSPLPNNPVTLQGTSSATRQ
jgi:hypothetical protein